MFFVTTVVIGQVGILLEQLIVAESLIFLVIAKSVRMNKIRCEGVKLELIQKVQT